MKKIWVNPPELYQLRLNAKLHIEQAAQLAGVSLRTYKKYELTGKIPKPVHEMLIARAGAIWTGWTWWDGYLYDDVGRKWHRGSLMAAYYTLKAAEAENVHFFSVQDLEEKKVNRGEPIEMKFSKKVISLQKSNKFEKVDRVWGK